VLAPLLHQQSFLEACAEREVSRQLGGSCRVPLAAFAHTIGNTLQLTACVGSCPPDGTAEVVSTMRTVELSGQSSDLDKAVAMARQAVAELKTLGAEAMLARHLV
jgi:hydroxymethylbilane synthase